MQKDGENTDIYTNMYDQIIFAVHLQLIQYYKSTTLQ